MDAAPHSSHFLQRLQDSEFGMNLLSPQGHQKCIFRLDTAAID